jgi:hypothetical protein
MLYKSILNAVGVVVAVTAVLLVGCGDKEICGCDDDNGNNNGGGGGTALIINGVQVYDNIDEGLESNYTGSFTHFYNGGFGYVKFTDFFTDPVVNVTNGKLTINLEPSNLMPIQDYMGGCNPENPEECVTFSDPTVKMLLFGDQRMFGNNCNYDGINNNCDAFLSAYYDAGIWFEDDIFFIYVDKPLTINANGVIVLKLRKGWNLYNPLAITAEEVVITDFSNLKWEIDFPQNR